MTSAVTSRWTDWTAHTDYCQHGNAIRTRPASASTSAITNKPLNRLRSRAGEAHRGEGWTPSVGARTGCAIADHCPMQAGFVFLSIGSGDSGVGGFRPFVALQKGKTHVCVRAKQSRHCGCARNYQPTIKADSRFRGNDGMRFFRWNHGIRGSGATGNHTSEAPAAIRTYALAGFWAVVWASCINASICARNPASN